MAALVQVGQDSPRFTSAVCNRIDTVNVCQLPQLGGQTELSTTATTGGVWSSEIGSTTQADSFASTGISFGNHLPQINSARTFRRLDVGDWASQTQSRMCSARELRKTLGTEMFIRRPEPSQSSRLNQRPCGSNTTALEEKLKSKLQNEKNISLKLYAQLDRMSDTLSRVNEANKELNRLSGNVWVSLNIAEKRIDVRLRLPPEEQIQDALQDTLEHSVKELSAVHKTLSDWVRSGRQTHDSIAQAVEDMDGQRLTLPLDRSNFPTEYLEKMHRLEGEGNRFCKELAQILRKSESTRMQVEKACNLALKKRLTELHQFRETLEEEFSNNNRAISKAEKQLERWAQQIKEHDARPEHQFGDSGEGFAEFWKRAKISAAQLRKVQAAIKGAMYTGHAGRQLDVLFSRADRDGSGELDEDEVKRVLRCTLKVPPSVVSDSEISALCETIDADASNAVSVKELVSFLMVDTDIDLVRSQHQKTQETLEQLYEINNGVLADLQEKRHAWQVDRDCAQVNVATALEVAQQVDNKLAGDCVTRKKPLEPRMLHKVRVKLRQAAHGGSMHDIFSWYDYDLSGTLHDNELRKALRDGFRIPKYSISDAEISSLCAMIDRAGTGSVSISALVDFIQEEGEDTPFALAQEASDTDSPGNQRLKPGMRRQAPVRAAPPKRVSQTSARKKSQSSETAGMD